MADKQCPYCGQTLIKGNVNAPQENFLFLPEGLSMPYFRTRWVKVEGSTMIRKFQVFKKKDMFHSYCKQEAYMCQTCKKIIIDFSNEVEPNKVIEKKSDDYDDFF